MIDLLRGLLSMPGISPAPWPVQQTPMPQAPQMPENPGRFAPPMDLTPSAPFLNPNVAAGSIPNPSTGNPFTESSVTPSSASPVPTPAPAVGGPWQTTVEPPSFLDGLMKKAGDVNWGDVLKAAVEGGMRGMAMTPMSANNPGGLSLMGAGFTAANDRMKAEALAKQKADAANSKLKFDQTLATRKDTREERAASRADQDQKRKAEDSRVRNQVAVEKLMRVGANGTLPVDAKFKLQDQLLRYADKINKNGLMQPAELDAALRREQQRLESYYGVKSSGEPQGTRQPPKPGEVMNGYRFNGGDPSDKANWVKVN